MSNFLSLLLSMMCVLPCIAAVVFFKNIPVNARPFIYALWLMLPTEIAGRFSDIAHLPWIKTTAYNCFQLANLALFLWFFYLYSVISRYFCYILFVAAFLLHTAELIIEGKWIFFEKTYIVESLIFVVYCTKMITPLILESKKNLLTDFMFIILAATIVTSLFEILQATMVFMIPK